MPINETIVALYLLNNPGPIDVASFNSTLSIARGLWLDFLERMPNPEHLFLLQYFLFVTVLVCLMILLSYFLAPMSVSHEKLTSYECGFEPFGDARTKFDVHFYLVGILFLLFDLEVVYLFPWLFSFAVEANFLYGNLISMFVFLVFLGVGFVYEWRQNALIWTPLHLANLQQGSNKI